MTATGMDASTPTAQRAKVMICALLDNVSGFTVADLGAIEDRLRRHTPLPNRGGPKRGQACDRNHPGRPSRWTQMTLKKRSRLDGSPLHYESAVCLECRAAQREKRKQPVRCRKNHPDIPSRFSAREKADTLASGETVTRVFEECLECKAAVAYRRANRVPACWDCGHKLKLHREGLCEHRSPETRKLDCECVRSACTGCSHAKSIHDDIGCQHQNPKTRQLDCECTRTKEASR